MKADSKVDALHPFPSTLKEQNTFVDYQTRDGNISVLDHGRRFLTCLLPKTVMRDELTYFAG